MEKRAWGKEGFWIDVLENKLYPPEAIIKEAALRELVKDEDFNGKRVLDYGCGAGAIGKMLRDMGADVVGTDISEVLLKRAAERIEVKWAEGTSLPFEDGTFDYVLSIMVFMVIKNLEEAVSEVHRVLKPGGRLFFAVLHPFCDRWDLETGLPVRDASSYNKIGERAWIFNLTDGRRFEEHYIHRPLEKYFSVFSKFFSIRRLLEPTLPEEYLKDGKYARVEYLFGEAVRR